MSPQTLVSKKNGEPMLIVDKEGIIGEKLAKKLSLETTVVLVTVENPGGENIVFIAYDKKIPSIPDNKYSHIFLIDNKEKTTKEAISSFLDKAQNDGSFLIFITSFREANEKLIEEVTGFYKKAKIVFHGDVFGADRPIDNQTPINKFIKQAEKQGKIDLPENSTEPTYPIHFDDLISGILEVAFGQTEEKIFNLFPKHPTTFLTLAHMIQKSNPNIKIDFTKNKINDEIQIAESGKYILEDNYPLEEKIRKLDIKINYYEEDDSKIDEPGFQGRSLRIAGIFVVLVILSLPLISTLLLIFLGNTSMHSITIYLNKGDFERARKSSDFAKTYFYFSDKTSNLLSYETGFFLREFTDNTKKTIIFSQNKSLGASLLLNGIKNSDLAGIKSGLVYLQKERVELPMLSFASNTIDAWEDLLGFKTQKTYLVLIQNKKEIRGTGGVIEKYALMTLNKGKIESFIEEETDGFGKNIQGTVEPPFAIRRYLGISDLDLKNSNFGIDFSESSSTSALLVSLAKDRNVDGILAIDEVLLTEVKNQKTSYLSLLSKIDKSLTSKDLIFSFGSPEAQNVFTINNWTGSLWDGRFENEDTIFDFLGVIDTNLGKNSNALISKSVSQETRIGEDGVVESTISINYQNKGGDLNNYIRLVLPQGTEIREIKIDGVTKDTIPAITDPQEYEDEDFSPPEELEIEEYNQSGKKVFGFLLSLQANSNKEVLVTYTLSNIAKTESHFTYNQKILKQPGTSFSYTFSFAAPEGFEIKKGESSLKEKIDKDFNFEVQLVKN